MGRGIQVRIRDNVKTTEQREKLAGLLAGDIDPNFVLPKFSPWPVGEKSLTDRAEILMQAGIEYLEKIFPKNQIQEDSRVTEVPMLKENQLQGW